MWIAILYMCLADKCLFVDSPPSYTKEGCIEMAQAASRQLTNDPTVVAFDLTCINVKLSET
jgi:hypothetical protein